uniref:Uncharacterized protein n=1 Tax=Setaria digitata TaxID=48799 RepID=A0A915PKX7_9BILA
MPKLKKKKKKNTTVNVLIPEKPTANLTTSMRNELYSTPEYFENTSSHQASSISTITNATTKGAELTMEMKKQSQMSSKKETPEKEVSKNNVLVTEVNDVLTYDADVVGTFSQSSGTVSYDSVRSMNNDSLEKAKITGKYIQNTDKELHKVVMEQMIEDSSKIPKIRFISDAELDHRNVQQELENRKNASAIPLWGLYETILTKKCIDEVVENFFASPRDDIEVTMKLSRRDMYPRLHVELSPIYGDLHIEAARFRQNTTTVPVPLTIGSRRRRFDDILRTDGLDDYLASTDLSMQSMESRSASMCCAKSSDATTARSPSYDYLSSAYSYVVAFVKVSHEIKF